ncbi:hypothetical protein ACT453_10305, partial [Bacillus sp. D-CC]
LCACLYLIIYFLHHIYGMARCSQRSSDRTDRVKESIQQQEKSVQEISISIEHVHNAAGELKQIVAQFTLQK